MISVTLNWADLAPVENEKPIANAVGVSNIVRNEHDSDPPVAGSGHEFQNLLRLGQRERGRGLIQNSATAP